MDSLAAERRAGRLPQAAVPEDVAVSGDIVGSDANRPLPDFAPPAPSAPLAPAKPHLAKARDAADQALDRLAMDAYQLLANPTMPDIAHPADTKIIKGGFIERRNGAGRQNNSGLFKTAAIAGGLAAAGAVIFLIIWPMIGGNASPEPQQKVAAAAPLPVAKPVERSQGHGAAFHECAFGAFDIGHGDRVIEIRRTGRHRRTARQLGEGHA